ncbi:hypothetical protein D3C80_558040 [compost metagenome]
MRGRLIVTAALSDIPHSGQRVGILRVGLQYLLKLTFCRISIAAVQRGIPFTFRGTANIFAIVRLHFAVLRMTLQPGVVELLVTRFGSQPQQRLTQACIRVFAATRHLLELDNPVAARAFLPGQHFAQRYACGVVLRVLRRKAL